MQTFTRVFYGATAIVVSLSLVDVSDATASPLRLVARTGQMRPVPGTLASPPSIEARLDSIESYSMNNLGQAAFSARTSRGTAVWSETSGDLAFAIERGPVPGLPPNSVYSFQAFYGVSFPPSAPLLRLDDQGRTLYGGLVDWPSSANLRGAAAYWTHQGDHISLIAGEGTPAPLSYAGMYFRELGSFDSFPRSGHGVAYKSATGGEFFAVPALLGFIGSGSTSVQRSLWVMGPAGPRHVQTLSGPFFGSQPLDLAVNRLGDAAYERFSPTGGLMLMREQAETAATIFDRTTAYPGAAPGAYFIDAADLHLNDAGTLGFMGVAGGPRDFLRDQGLFVVDAAGAMRNVVLEGAAVPDVPNTPLGLPGAIFRGANVVNTPFRLRALGANDEVVFQASLTTPAGGATQQETLWIDRDGALTRLLSAGDSMPGLPADQRLLTGFTSPFTQVQINDQGMIVVQAAYSRVGANPGSGIWALKPGADDFTLIAAIGQSLELPDGTAGALSTLTLGEVNSRGQILMKARYGQYDALIISNAVAIPEPSSLLLMVSLAALMSARRSVA